VNYNIAGNPEDSPDAIDSIFGDVLHAPKHFLIMRTKKGRSEYYQSMKTNWSRTRWTTSRDAATGFATEGEAEEFKQSFRLPGEVVPNDVR
jgi:hypothetical protein